VELRFGGAGPWNSIKYSLSTGVANLPIAPQLSRSCAVIEIQLTAINNETHGYVLGRDSIKQFYANGDTHMCDLIQELPGYAQALVDFEGSVDVWRERMGNCLCKSLGS